MVTFTLLCIGLATIACLIASAVFVLIVLGVLTCGVVLDVALGVLPFALVGFFIYWLLKGRKEKKDERQCEDRSDGNDS